MGDKAAVFMMLLLVLGALLVVFKGIASINRHNARLGHAQQKMIRGAKTSSFMHPGALGTLGPGALGLESHLGLDVPQMSESSEFMTDTGTWMDAHQTTGILDDETSNYGHSMSDVMGSSSQDSFGSDWSST